MTTTESVYKRDKLILSALWSFICGVLLASLVNIPPLVCVLGVVVALAIYYADKQIIIPLILCGLALGAFRYDIKDFHELMPAGSRGIIVSEPEHRDADTRFVVKTDTGEKVLVSADLLSEVEYGDEVSLIGKAQIVKGDYGWYLSKDDIFYTMSFAKVSVISRDHGNPVRRTLLNIKSAFVEKMRHILPEPESSLLAGLVVSGKQALSSSILSDFRRAGVVHIVVLSGYNITIIAEFFLLIFGFLGQRKAAGISALGIVLFTLMSGATATVVRAAIMVLLLLLGKVLGRSGSAPRILLFTAVLMLLENPKILVFDPSFELSFLAMLALIYGVPIVEKYLSKIPEKFGIRTLLATTLATQIVVLPFLLYNMGNFSTVFLLSNLLILLVIPFTMLIGFVATLLASISSVLAWPLAFLSHILLGWILFVANFLGNLPFAMIQIENFPLWGTLVLYAGLAATVWRLSLPAQSGSSARLIASSN
ncbi:ComEC family competence protein [Candidatus Parcubacteria bacterium]|nr:ComEC family competence protein [Candidatus Parcubacteria bacterium]